MEAKTLDKILNINNQAKQQAKKSQEKELYNKNYVERLRKRYYENNQKLLDQQMEINNLKQELRLLREKLWYERIE